MLKYLLVVLFFLVSCLSPKKNDLDAKKELPGNWLILYPQHILNNSEQRKIYTKAQDSIVNLMGLKLVSFMPTGEFFQADSLFGDHGTWSINDSGNLKITSAGEGLANFKGTVVGILNDTILIEEIVRIENEQIKLIWHLKKIERTDEAAGLFEGSKNLWRQRPAKKENTEKIKERVISMLKYYSLYFKLVSAESIYFSPVRVYLPFSYYQHGVGLKRFEPGGHFANCFFDPADANKGYDFIKTGFEKISNEDFPSGKNFVIEYSAYFEKLANKLEKE